MRNCLIIILYFVIFCGCSDEGDWLPCTGYTSEPLFVLICNMDSIKVIHTNSSNIQDSVSSRGFREVLLPIDMNDSVMTYEVLRNDSIKGKVTLNYELDFVFDKRLKCNEFVLDFEMIEAHVTSDLMDTTIYPSQWFGEMSLEINF